MKMETSHINPLTGEVEGRGGILLVRDLFPTKQIIAYRAPGCCWSPPHTEALRDLGIKFDFSSNFSSKPVYYKGLTFYPHPIIAQWQAKFSDYSIFWLSVLRHRVTVIGLHPSSFVNQDEWDSIYWDGNPKHITPPCPREIDEIESLFHSLNLFLKQIKWFEKMRLIEVVSSPRKSERNLTVTKNTVEKCYETIVAWAKKFFNYEPKFLRRHFFKFFNLPFSNSENNTYLN